MEVSGRKGDRDTVACNPCKDQGFSKLADGFCGECEEYMCQHCFDTHIKFKFNRDHTFTNPEDTAAKKEQTEELEKCNDHYKKSIKFFCPKHEKVGCGDCMILDHKTCKVEYIRDRASTFKDSQEFKELTEGARKCECELKEMLTSIKCHKKQISDNNQKFAHDVNMFREEIIAHVNKLTNSMLKQGEDTMAQDMKKLVELEKKGESLVTELSLLTEEIESHIDKPNKLFVHSISQKPMLLRLEGELGSIRGKNRIDICEFRRDENIERLITECKQLGRLQQIERVIEKVRHTETEQTGHVKAKPIPQPLLERQLLCRNMTVDGEYLSYMDNGRGDVGLYVDMNRSYFEIEILSLGQHGTIAIGLVPLHYPETTLPGYGPDSIGYNAGDGLLYNQDGSGTKCGPTCQAGDRFGVGIIDKGYGWYDVVFTRNGKKIGETNRICFGYPAVGMHSPGEKVKVILDAKMPEM